MPTEEQNNITRKCPLCTSSLKEISVLPTDGSPAEDGWECRACDNIFDSTLESMLDKR